MNKKKTTLWDLKKGEEAKVNELLNDENMKRRLLDLGLSKDCKVRCVSISPLKDPKAYLIKGSVIAIRKEDSEKVIITKED